MEITPEIYTAVYRMLSEGAQNILINCLELAGDRTWFSVQWSGWEGEIDQEANFKALIALGLLTITSETEASFGYRRQEYHYTKLGFNLAKGLKILKS